MLCSCLPFSQIRLTKLKDIQSGLLEKGTTLCVCLRSPLVRKTDDLHVMAKHLAATASYMCSWWDTGSTSLSCYSLTHSHTATEDYKRLQMLSNDFIPPDLSEIYAKYFEGSIASLTIICAVVPSDMNVRDSGGLKSDITVSIENDWRHRNHRNLLTNKLKYACGREYESLDKCIISQVRAQRQYFSIFFLDQTKHTGRKYDL